MGTCPVSYFLNIDHCALKKVIPRILRTYLPVSFHLSFIVIKFDFHLVPKTFLFP